MPDTKIAPYALEGLIGSLPCAYTLKDVLLLNNDWWCDRYPAWYWAAVAKWLNDLPIERLGVDPALLSPDRFDDNRLTIASKKAELWHRMADKLPDMNDLWPYVDMYAVFRDVQDLNAEIRHKAVGFEVKERTGHYNSNPASRKQPDVRKAMKIGIPVSVPE